MQCLIKYFFAAVTCEVKNYTAERLANPPYAVSHDGEVGYNDTLVIYCFVPGKGNFTKEQRCEYDSEKGKYFLYGESFECGGTFFLILSFYDCKTTIVTMSSSIDIDHVL